MVSYHHHNFIGRFPLDWSAVLHVANLIAGWSICCRPTVRRLLYSKLSASWPRNRRHPNVGFVLASYDVRIFLTIIEIRGSMFLGPYGVEPLIKIWIPKCVNVMGTVRRPSTQKIAWRLRNIWGATLNCVKFEPELFLGRHRMPSILVISGMTVKNRTTTAVVVFFNYISLKGRRSYQPKAGPLVLIHAVLNFRTFCR